MAGDLTFLQEQVLLALREGRCFGQDMRQVRGLVMRNLVEMVEVRADDVVMTLPRVTQAGMAKATELVATAAKREYRRRMERAGIRFIVAGGRR